MDYRHALHQAPTEPCILLGNDASSTLVFVQLGVVAFVHPTGCNCC